MGLYLFPSKTSLDLATGIMELRYLFLIDLIDYFIK